jgi:Xaa-Pro aminopeptidase
LILAESARDPDLAPFTGSIHLGRSLLVAPLGGEPRLGHFSPLERREAAATGLATLDPEALEIERSTRETAGPGALVGAVAARALTLAGVGPRPVALAGHGAAGTLHAAGRVIEAGGWALRPGDELIRLLRKRKPAWQAAEIRRAAAGAAAAFHRLARLLAASSPRRSGGGGELWLGAERLSVGRLRAAAAAALGAAGLGQPEGNLVAAGADGAVPHTAGGDDRVLRAGESLVVDLFPAGALYADCTRTFCVGRPPEALAAAHQAVLTALGEARAGARAGVQAWQLQEAVCRLLEARGYRTPLSHPRTTVGYVHNLGHGVGFELQEYPSFRKETGAEGLLATGDVFTLEPGLYDPDAGWAVRVEDLMHLGADGPEVLTPLPYELDPRGWAN